MNVSNPGKVLFPDTGITKGDLAAYYERVARPMLPHVKGRPISMQRFPDGISRARRSVLSRSLHDGTARTSQRHQEDDEQDAKARRHHATLDL